MATEQPSYSQLTRDTVQASPVPLPVAEIVRRVHAIRPITTKNPERTIRTAIGAGAMLVNTGDGRYGWKTRVINGSTLRHTLREPDFLREALQYNDELQDAMSPTFHAQEQNKDLGPAGVKLPDGTTVELPFQRLYGGVWGTHATPAFWAWLEAQGAETGDHLIFKTINAEDRAYDVRFEGWRERDEAAIAERNQVFLEMIVKMLNRPYGAAPWDITTHALARGYYQHPIPPDPLYKIWRDDIWHLPPPAEPAAIGPHADLDPLLSALFARQAQVYDPERPPELPREYDPNLGGRRPRPSRKAQAGVFSSYTFRVNHRALPEVWREIELAEDQTLEDLHLAIQHAYGWHDDHLYSFFMSGQAWDEETEIGCPWSETRLHTHQVQVDQLELQEGRRFLYLFDYGDGREFDVQLVGINRNAPQGTYPRMAAKRGESPPQYPGYDEDTGELSWDPYSHFH